MNATAARAKGRTKRLFSGRKAGIIGSVQATASTSLCSCTTGRRTRLLKLPFQASGRPARRRFRGTVRNRHALQESNFGELLRATGPMAFTNPFRFSTKYQDDETGLLYYGYRYYNPSTARWLSRDPMEERGGRNLYAALRNNPPNAIDKLGRLTITIRPPFSDIQDAVDELTAALPKDEYDKVVALYKNAKNIKDIWDDIKDANEVAELVTAVLSAQDKSAVQELVAMGAQSAVEDGLKVVGVPSIYVKGIIEGGQIGTAFGNSVAKSLKKIANQEACQACTMEALDDLVPTGEVFSGGNFAAGRKIKCYKTSDGIVFADLPFTVDDVEEKRGFVQNLIKLFGAPDDMWARCTSCGNK